MVQDGVQLVVEQVVEVGDVTVEPADETAFGVGKVGRREFTEPESEGRREVGLAEEGVEPTGRGRRGLRSPVRASVVARTLSSSDRDTGVGSATTGSAYTVVAYCDGSKFMVPISYGIIWAL